MSKKLQTQLSFRKDGRVLRMGALYFLEGEGGREIYIYIEQLTRKSFAQRFDRCCHFFFANSIVFLFFCDGLKTLPWKASSVEVHQNVSKRFEIVSSTLFYERREKYFF